MVQSHEHSSGLLKRGKRLLMVLGAAAVFIGAASVIKPDPQGARAGTGNHDEMPGLGSKARVDLNPTNPKEAELVQRLKERAAQSVHPKGWKLIGMLEGREHILKCWGTNDGPRYSVHALDGRLIQDDLPADEVYRGFPDIELPNLRVDPPTGGGTLVDFVDVWRE